MYSHSDIVKDFKAATGLARPDIEVRSGTNGSGDLGESYLMASANCLKLYCRKLGEEFVVHSFDMPSIGEIRVEELSPFSKLHITAAGKTYSLEVPSYDLGLSERLISAWKASQAAPPAAATDAVDVADTGSAGTEPEVAPAAAAPTTTTKPSGMAAPGGMAQPKTTGTPAKSPAPAGALRPAAKKGALRPAAGKPTVPMSARLQPTSVYRDPAVKVSGPRSAPPPAPGEFSGMVGLSAALQSLMEVDGDVAAEERDHLNRIIDDADLIAQGKRYLEAHGDVKLYAKLAEILDRPQKLCLLANLIEMAMADGVIRKIELAQLRHVTQTVGVSKDDMAAIYDVLKIKNQLSVFGA